MLCPFCHLCTMKNEWVLLFDKTKAGDRAKDINLQQVVDNFKPEFSAVPAIVGHDSSYPKDTRIPVGAWVKEVMQEAGQKLFGKYEKPERLDVKAPKRFEKLVGMSDFFEDAVNKGLWKKRSVGIIDTPNGHSLHHVAYLGAALPECKGMPDHEFNQHPELRKLTTDFSAETTILEFEEESIMPKQKGKIKEFEAFDPSKLEDDDIVALGKIIDMLREDYGLESDASTEQILGAMTTEESEDEEVDEALATLGAAVLTPGTMISSFSEEQVKKSPLLGALNTIVKELSALKTKVVEFENAPATPAAGTTPAATTPAAPATGTTGELQVATLGKPETQCNDEAQKAKETLDAAKNWVPSWDDKLLPLMSTLANVKTDSGSALDTLVSALNDISGIAEMQEYSQVIDFAETIRERKEAKKEEGFVARKGEKVGNLNLRKKVKEYQAKNPGKSYLESYDNLVELGEITDSDVE